MRDYASMLAAPPHGVRGVFVPRRLLLAALFAAASFAGYMAFAPSKWTIQRLEAPDGSRTAVLSRTQLGRPHFVIKVREGLVWRTLYLSPPITNGFREDLGERLSWTTNPVTLHFRLQGREVWRRPF